MQLYIELGALAWEHLHCKGNSARSKLSLDATRSMHAEFYDLPDDARLDTSAHAPNPYIKTIRDTRSMGE